MRRAGSARASAGLALALGAAAACDGARGTAAPGGDSGTACAFTAREDELPTPAIYTPKWAFEPWISKDISDAADSRAFVDGFRERGIPVGVLVLDSPWETSYNTFAPSPTRYPDFARFVAEMHGKGVRVVLWTTALVNELSFDLEEGGDRYEAPAPNFEPGLACGFFVNEGQTWNWWKGRGASVDFFHPGARAWWHAQQDAVLDAGIDGWKLDFGDSYVRAESVRTAQGPVAHQRYSEEYYRDFWAHGVKRTGRRDFITMVRPWDESYDHPGRFFARPEHAPVAWVGDNRRDWVGLADALDSIFRSARAGYAVLGSDVGGYLDADDKDLTVRVPFDQDNFARWTAAAALTPFMQLHGRANLTPWTVPVRVEETVALWRYWANLHHDLVPFFFSLAIDARAGGGSPIAPQGEPSAWAGDYRWVLGRALLVAPLLDGSGRRDVLLPAGERWYDWWHPEADALEGGQVLRAYDATEQRKIPLFVRAGAIVPMESAWAVWPGPRSERFVLREEDGTSTEITVSGAEVTLSRVPRAVTLRVRADAPVASVTVGGASHPFTEDAATRAVSIALAATASPIQIRLAPR